MLRARWDPEPGSRASLFTPRSSRWPTAHTHTHTPAGSAMLRSCCPAVARGPDTSGPMHSAPSLSAWHPPETTSTLVSTLHPTESHLSVPTAANASDTLYSLSVTYVPMLDTYYLVTIYDVMSSYVQLHQTATFTWSRVTLHGMKTSTPAACAARPPRASSTRGGGGPFAFSCAAAPRAQDVPGV